jgi:glycine/D-amino acid oxidase-like deaminating enzyme/nitrite reductase/ring-hydroxylating ferredoxin subunit
MRDTKGTISVWRATGSVPPREPLSRDTGADVCVVGAGIAGLSAAYELAREGRTVVVLERDGIGSGETGRTTAHLVTAFDDRYAEIEEHRGPEAARALAQSHGRAIERAAQIVAAERIDASFERVDGYLMTGDGDGPGVLRKELEAARRAGLGSVQLVERAPVASFDTGPCLLFPGQAQFHPLAYLGGLAAAVERMGGTIHCGTNVEAVEDGTPAKVRTTGGASVVASDVVVATYTPFIDRVKMHTKQAAYRTYVVGMRLGAGAFPRVLLWDTGHPYHYVRVETLPDGGDLLIAGAEDHKTGQAHDQEERLGRLEAWTRERVRAGETVFRWSGQVLEPTDGVAFIGRNPGDEHVFIVTGDSGNGVTHGILGSLLVRDLVAGRENPWAATYDPSRKPLESLGRWAKENLNAAGQYKDWVTPAETDSAASIRPGDAAIVRRGMKKCAVHRDAGGGLHERTAVCPHLGGIVGWNPLERSWDCPAHGSRFDCEGAVLNGPANVALGPAPPET